MGAFGDARRCGFEPNFLLVSGMEGLGALYRGLWFLAMDFGSLYRGQKCLEYLIVTYGSWACIVHESALSTVLLPQLVASVVGGGPNERRKRAVSAPIDRKVRMFASEWSRCGSRCGRSPLASKGKLCFIDAASRAVFASYVHRQLHVVHRQLHVVPSDLHLQNSKNTARQDLERHAQARVKPESSQLLAPNE